jgi:hypothetical protein
VHQRALYCTIDNERTDLVASSSSVLGHSAVENLDSTNIKRFCLRLAITLKQ